ncbi:hypothetical protein FSP39_008994 [Pinctada imbricata]|uniref:Uncharacterized protein n=1 Tax=Pinctada imbricata TaxID=66713 RepID=A0AA88Y9W0_PINIB|nr:hypothetical protein FSP39_008994 [Pinctada imbricata]
MESSENHDMKYQDFYIPYADDTTSVSDQTYDVLQLNTNGSLQYIPSETDSFKGGAPFASTAALLQVQETRMSVSITTVNEDEMTLDPSTQSPGYNFSFKTTPRDKKFLLLAIGLVNLFAATSFSLLGPFFPQKAVDKGASQTVVGLIFGVFEFVSFISSPVFGTSPEGYQFVLMCFLTRAMDALGTSALATSSYAVLAFTFPRYLATVVGYLEMFTGVGMMLGPAIGGALYSVSCYKLLRVIIKFNNHFDVKF